MKDFHERDLGNRVKLMSVAIGVFLLLGAFGIGCWILTLGIVDPDMSAKSVRFVCYIFVVFHTMAFWSAAIVISVMRQLSLDRILAEMGNVALGGIRDVITEILKQREEKEEAK